jgi:hypothetical protein
MASELDISLNIRNNTNYPQEINIMGNPANLLDTSNATLNIGGTLQLLLLQQKLLFQSNTS